MNKFSTWIEQRQQSVTGTQGDLSLIQMYDIVEARTVPEVTGIWTPTQSDKPGLTVTVNVEDQLSVEGKRIEGTFDLVADHTIVTAADGRTMMATSQPDSQHLLAIWDEKAETLQQFETIDRYAYNDEAVLEGTWLPDEEEQLFSFKHTSDQDGAMRQHISPGSILIEYKEQQYKLRPFAAGDQYIIVFRDLTSDDDTYGTGRMLVVQPDEQGRVKVDFNYAFLPPCAFSIYFNCPMPPFSNRFRARIEAGEKNVVRKK